MPTGVIVQRWLQQQQQQFSQITNMEEKKIKYKRGA
jgi:hypothetical protein